ncbi:MAG: glycosyltransferase family 2 protein [Nitrospiraceae bacterium]
MTEVIFWAAAGFVIYAYVGYPTILFLLSMLGKLPVRRDDITPPVSFIITAHNEEKRIQQKIENSLEQDYPKDRLEIIVASDCSTDRTDEIAMSYGAQEVRLIRATERRGKEHAQKLAVDQASGGIIIFSDVATILSKDGIRNIVKNFHDPSVGCVSSIDQVINNDGKISGEGAYVRYEMFLRGLESRVNSVVGLSGSFFAARREVCRVWNEDLQSDFNTLLNSVDMGLRGVSDPDSIGYYRNVSDEREEYGRKLRTLVRGMNVLGRRLPLLNPFKYGMFSWQLFSHKVCRWMVPFAMISAVLSNAALISSSSLYGAVFIAQMVFYMSAFVGLQFRSQSRICSRSLFRIPAFFLLSNLSILHAWFRFVSGEKIVSWEPSRRGVQGHSSP